MDEETGSQRENMISTQHTASAEIPNANLIQMLTLTLVLFPLFLLPTYLILLPSNHFLHLPILALKIITLLEKVLLCSSICFQESPINVSRQHT